MNIINTPKYTSIDFNSNEIRIVEGKATKKTIQINKYCSIGIPNGIYEDGIINDSEQLAYLIKTGLSTNKISLGNTFAVINSSEIILREVLFPKVDPKDIDNLIKYQLGDYIPIHPEDYVVNYIILGTQLDNGIEKLNLLLIGVPITIVESHLNLLKDIGLKPLALDYKGNAICKLLGFNGNLNNITYSDKTIAFIEISYDNTSLTIIKDGYIRVSRIIEHNFFTLFKKFKDKLGLEDDDIIKKIESIEDISIDISPNDSDYDFRKGIKESIQDIMGKTEMIFRYYRTREVSNNIDTIVLHGDMSKVEGIDKLFENFFNIECVKLNSISKLKFDGDLSLYANAIGGLIRLNGVKA